MVAPGLESSKKAQGCKREGKALAVYEIKKFVGAKSTCKRGVERWQHLGNVLSGGRTRRLELKAL